MKKQAIVTTSWDDGHKLDLKLAKLLKKYGIKGTFYISPKNREFKDKDLLLTRQIRQLSQDFEIGAHTMTHPLLTKIGEEESFREIKDSKAFLERLINKKVETFCYPRGLYNKKTKQLVKNAGFIGARTVKRFCILRPVDSFEFGTTVQVFRHRISFGLELPIKINLSFIPSLFKKDWVIIAKKTFDYINKNGGIYHLWGHSWEVDKYNDWKKLEEILSYIGNRSNVKYLENSELFKKDKI